MTKSRGIGRGGKRAGSGRKSKPVAPHTDPVEATGCTPEELARRHLDRAIKTLDNISSLGASEAARVAAAKAIVEIAGGGKTAKEPLGKKEQQQADAESAGKGSDWESDLSFDGRLN